MRINIGQTTNLFHVNALNQSVQRNTSEKEDQKSPIRTDIASISPMGKAAVRLQNLVNQIEISQEGLDNFLYQVENGTNAVISGEKAELKKLWEDDAEYWHIIDNSDDDFHKPTVESELWGTYMGYLNEAYEKGKAPEKDIYEHIVDMYTNSLAKAYQDVYQDIVSGYENGTREVWTQDFDEGADYIEFELEGKNYRFHKLTMEEELARLDKAYEKASKDVENRANAMIDTARTIEKVMPEYKEKMRQIEAKRAGMEISEAYDDTERMAERIKDSLLSSEENTEKFNIFELLMEARKNWLNAKLP